MKTIDTIITNIGKLITCDTKFSNLAKIGKQMNDLEVKENVDLGINNGLIVEISKNLYKKYKANNIIDANKNLVIPGFVDSHTHLVYGGNRFKDLDLRLKGASYLEILKAGGGIHSTVSQTRDSSYDELLVKAKEFLNLAITHGTTSIEIKSGYGLDYNNELKILKIINDLKKEDKINIVSTYLGAHTYPKDVDKSTYLDLILNKCLPDFKPYSDFCDVYSEEASFSLNDAEKILNKAKSLNYKLKIHSGQFTNNNSASMAAKLKAVSVDHFDNYNDEDIFNLKENNTVATLLPASNFYLLNDKYPNARYLIDKDVIVSLASDFNPGSAPCISMQFVIALAFYKLRMTISEAIIASTINAAYALNLNHLTGSIEINKRADLIIFKVKDPIEIPYFFGANLVDIVLANGINLTEGKAFK